MSNEESRRSALGRLRTAVIVVLLVFCVGAIALAWRHQRFEAALLEEESRLIEPMAESVLRANQHPVQVQVALFDAGLDDGSATKDLKRILTAESAFAWKTVSPIDIQGGALEGFDVAIFPGGFAPKQAAALGDDGQQAVRVFVHAGVSGASATSGGPWRCSWSPGRWEKGVGRLSGAAPR